MPSVRKVSRKMSRIALYSKSYFVSKECELRCEYPARPYFVREAGERIEFLSETRCPYKDASIVWRGVVEDDTIKGVATWTINRWYWTIERKYELFRQAQAICRSVITR